MCLCLTEEVLDLGSSLTGIASATGKDRRVALWNGRNDRELYCMMD